MPHTQKFTVAGALNNIAETIGFTEVGAANTAAVTEDLTLAGALNVLAGDGTNLVSNTGFETDTSGWFVSGGSLARSTAQAFKGVASGLVTPDGLSATVESGLAAGSSPAASPGDEFRWVIWVFSPNGFDIVPAISWLGTLDVVLSTSEGPPVSVPAGKWTGLSVTAVAPVDTLKASPRIILRNTPATTDTVHMDTARFVRTGSGNLTEARAANVLAETTGLTLAGALNAYADSLGV